MKKSIKKIIILCLSAFFLVPLFSQGKNTTIEKRCPGLASGALKSATMGELPAGIILKSKGITISKSDINADITANKPELRQQLDIYKFFVLEQNAIGKILPVFAKEKLASMGKTTSGLDDNTLIQQFFSIITEKITMPESELKKFYNENKSMMGGAPYTSVKSQIENHLLGQKKQEEVSKYVDRLGESIPITISKSWALAQCKKEKDNPVAKARASGLPTLVEFGAKGCVPCDMMQPVLDNLEVKYKGRLNIVFIHVGEQQILGSKYGVRSIPVQVFFDKNGKEFFRHTGFYEQAKVEKKLAAMGLK